MHRKILLLTVVTITCGFIAGSPLAAQPIPFAVALSGTPAPAGGNYGAFTLAGQTLFPVINESGRVYFNAPLTGGSSQGGIFVGTPGSVQAVAIQGGTSPSGGTYTVNFSDLVQNNAGQVAFSCSLVGTNVQGLYSGLPGVLQTVAVTGNPAPGGGGNIYSNGFTSPLQNPSGVVAFSTDLTGGTSTTGFFLGTPGSVQSVALQGNPAPAGGNYSSFSSRTLNAVGQVCFVANLTGGLSNSGIFLGTPGSLQTVALQGTPAPSGGNFSNFSIPALNNSGHVAFFAITGSPVASGIYAGTPGSLQTVAFMGSPAPAGGNYSGSFGTSVLNGSGQVAFMAGLTGGSATSGIFVGLPGSLQAGALQGSAAPGGGLFSTFQSSPQLNGLGQIAFVATLSGPGIDSTNDQGLYAGAPGALIKVIRKGDQVDVDPGPGIDLRTVSGIGFRIFTNPTGGEDGRGVAFTDNGFTSYLLTFTDGSSGVFYSNLTVIPEPTSMALMLVLGLGVFVWYGRRKLLAAQMNESILEPHEEALGS